MKKSLCFAVSIFVLGTLCFQTAYAECLVTGEQYGVGARAAVVMEVESGELLFAQNSDKQLPMASTTKILTALITLEQENLYDQFIVDPQAIMVEGSSMGLTEGDMVTLHALAGGMLTASGNDAANAAAVAIAGSLPQFAEMMNARAAEIGMLNSHFVTPSGLDDEQHFSTARDMALLGSAAIQNPLFREMCSAKSLRLHFGMPPFDRTLENHNRLLRLYPGCIGIKTGFTKTSGRCLVSAAEKNGVTLVCVTLNCGDDWNTHVALYDRYFSMVERRAVEAPTDLELNVVGGEKNLVAVAPQDEFSTTAIKNKPIDIEYKVFASNFYYAPIKRGDNMGKIVYYKGSNIVGETPLLATEDVPAPPEPPKTAWGKFTDWITERLEAIKG